MKEDYGKKEYLNDRKIEDVRQMFKTRVGLLPFVGNFSHDKRFANTGWLCRCGVKENETHTRIRHSSAYLKDYTVQTKINLQINGPYDSLV